VDLEGPAEMAVTEVKDQTEKKALTVPLIAARVQAGVAMEETPAAEEREVQVEPVGTEAPFIYLRRALISLISRRQILKAAYLAGQETAAIRDQMDALVWAAPAMVGADPVQEEIRGHSPHQRLTAQATLRLPAAEVYRFHIPATIGICSSR